MFTAFCTCIPRSNLCFSRSRFAWSWSISWRSSDNNNVLISSVCHIVSPTPCTILRYYELKLPRLARLAISSSTPLDNSIVSEMAFFSFGSVNSSTANVCSMKSTRSVARSTMSLLSASCDLRIYQRVKLWHVHLLRDHIPRVHHWYTTRKPLQRGESILRWVKAVSMLTGGPYLPECITKFHDSTEDLFWCPKTRNSAFPLTRELYELIYDLVRDQTDEIK